MKENLSLSLLQSSLPTCTYLEEIEAVSSVQKVSLSSLINVDVEK
jgi:hypothetical protein